MMRLQNDNYNLFAEYARPILLRYTDTAALGKSEAYYLRLLREWNLHNDPQEKGPTIFTAWWDSLQHVVFSDELNAFGKPLQRPDRFVLLEALLRGDSTFRFLDDVATPQREDAAACVNRALRMASKGLLDSLEARQDLAWGQFKNTTVYHLLRDAAKPFARPGLPIGGGANIINATTHEHGPSWRMVVQMSDPIEAYAVYPGGQDGNPGSRHYDRFIDDWARGKYYRLWFMRRDEADDARVLGRMSFKP
jgi:penicillin amidase